jgi:hypothetical protein
MAINLEPFLVNLVAGMLKSFLSEAKKKDKSNSGQLFAEWYFWDKLQRLADAKAETLKSKMIADELLKDPKTFEQPGTFEIGECPGFISTISVTEKVRTFSVQELAKLLNKSHKIPVPAVIQAADQAKVPLNCRRTVKIIER